MYNESKVDSFYSPSHSLSNEATLNYKDDYSSNLDVDEKQKYSDSKKFAPKIKPKKCLNHLKPLNSNEDNFNSTADNNNNTTYGSSSPSSSSTQNNNSLLFGISNMTNAANNQSGLFSNANPLGQLMNNNTIEFLNQSKQTGQQSLLQNLETNSQLFASYLNHLKFPFGLNALGSSAMPAQADYDASIIGEDLSLKHKKQADLIKSNKAGKRLDSHKIEAAAPLSSLSNSMNITKSVQANKSASGSKDVLDLSLPNRSRQTKASSMHSSLSTTSSLSPLSTVSSMSETANSSSVGNTSYFEKNASYESSADNLESKPLDLKKEKNSNKNKTVADDEEHSSQKRFKPDMSAESFSLMNKATLLATIPGQHNLLNSLLNAPQPAYSVEGGSPSAQSILNASLFSLQANQANLSYLNSVKQQQQHDRAKVCFNEDKQAPSSSNNNILEQLLHYTNYMKLVENYQKNFNMIQNGFTNTTSNNMNNNNNNQGFSQTNRGNNYSNMPMNLKTNGGNTAESIQANSKSLLANAGKRKPSIDPSQPLSLVIENARS